MSKEEQTHCSTEKLRGYLQASKEFLEDIKQMENPPKAEEPETPCS